MGWNEMYSDAYAENHEVMLELNGQLETGATKVESRSVDKSEESANEPAIVPVESVSNGSDDGAPNAASTAGAPAPVDAQPPLPPTSHAAAAADVVVTASATAAAPGEASAVAAASTVVTTSTAPAPEVTARAPEAASPTSEGRKTREYDADEHMLSLSQVAERYSTHIDLEHADRSQGLRADQIAGLREKYGRNVLTPPKDVPEIIKFLRGFLDGFMVLLMVAGALCILAAGLANWDRTNLTLGIVLFVVVLLTVIMNYIQEHQSNSVLDTVKKLLADKCIVIRDGKEATVDAWELVPGDIVRINNGGRVPADMRMIYVVELKVENSSLTGEADAIPVTVDRKHDLPLESRNLVFNSSLVVNGEGRGVVIRTGDRSMIGSIANLATATKEQPTNMEVEVNRFVKLIFVLAFVTAITMFIIGVARNPRNVSNAIVAFIVVLVANVPEGLPATVVSCLAITSKRMASRNVLVKQSRIIEALGAASVICSDKTGTLTQNKMTVENMWFNRNFQNVRGGIRRAPLPLPSAAVEATIGRSSMQRGASFRAPYGLHATIGRGLPAPVLQGPSAGQIDVLALANLPVNTDVAYSMTVGRNAVFTGDGRIEGVEAKPRSESKGSDAVTRSSSFYYGSFSNFGTFLGTRALARASWERANPYMRLVIMAGVCNRAYEEQAAGLPNLPHIALPMAGGPDRKLHGDASDRGLYNYVDAVIPVLTLRATFPAIFEIPFNSVNKWSYAIIRDPEEPARRHIGFMKGAPEIVMTKCTHYFFNGQERPIDDEFKADQMAAYERFGFMGERVLGFAYRSFQARPPDVYRTDETAYPTAGLVFLGMISLVDPPRDGVDDAVARCRSAAIRVTMVTGDHPLTAEAIARKVGIITLPTAREVAAEDGVSEADVPIDDPRVRAIVRSGAQIRGLSQKQWDDILTKDEVVFARTSPQQKLEIVENYQRLGHVVAVTGDGVNDSPALKKADIGVSMGSGDASEVAKEAAKILLLDNNFASIVNAIEEGRVLFDNLKKSIAYTLAHLWPELLPIFLNIAFSFPLALPGLIILVIDLITEQGPAISYAYEIAESSVMARPPRRIKEDRLVSMPLLIYTYAIAGGGQMLVAMFAYFMVYVYYGIPVSALAWTAETYFIPGAPDFVVNGRVYTESDQLFIYAQSVSAWFAMIVCSQFWHAWVCKTRFVSIFQHDMFGNVTTAGGVALALAIMLACVYIPWLQFIFATGNLIGVIWPITLLYGAYIFAYTELSKWYTRRHPDSWWAAHMAW